MRAYNVETSTTTGKQYEYIQRLGSGTYGTTWMAIDYATNTKVAIKMFTRPGKFGGTEMEDIKEDWEIDVSLTLFV